MPPVLSRTNLRERLAADQAAARVRPVGEGGLVHRVGERGQLGAALARRVERRDQAAGRGADDEVGRRPFSSSAWITPMWAKPRAAPPPRARPTRGGSGRPAGEPARAPRHRRRRGSSGPDLRAFGALWQPAERGDRGGQHRAARRAGERIRTRSSDHPKPIHIAGQRDIAIRLTSHSPMRRRLRLHSPAGLPATHVPIHRLRPRLRAPARRAVPRPARAPPGRRPERRRFRPLRLQNGWYVQRHAPMAARRRALRRAEQRSSCALAWPRDRRARPTTAASATSRRARTSSSTGSPLARRRRRDGRAGRRRHARHPDQRQLHPQHHQRRFAGVAADEIVDPRPYCEILRQWSTLHPEFAVPAAQVQDRGQRRARGPRRHRLARHRPAAAAQRRRASSASRCASAAAWAARRSSAR